MEQVDVLICGGGPVGLLTGYCLERFGVSTYVVEQHDRTEKTVYGRAAMIAPRCLEMLEQLDLADSLMQIGYVVRGQVQYKDGEKVDDAVTYASSNITDTFYDFLLLARQKFTEEAFRSGYRKYSAASVHYGCKLHRCQIDDQSVDHKVKIDLETLAGTQFSVRSKYLIGADGGRSTIREIAGIPFEREKTSRYFIRIDGVVQTNMPGARKGLCGIDSPSHGSVLWACLDHNITRVGFAFPKKLWEDKGAKLTQEDVVEEAKIALQPFTLEFETIDWWTAYSVGQGLADDYRAQDRIFIAGDAAHTHSSAAAQGMNTGLHDAVNLSWKLAGCIKGWYTDSILDSYAKERRLHAQHIIEQDKITSLLTAGEIPEQFQGDPNFKIQDAITDMYKRNQSLNTGIGVQYPADGLTLVEFPNLKVSAGERAPDVLVQTPGMRIPLRLFSLFKNICKFTIIVFSGAPAQTETLIGQFREYVDGPQSWERYSADLFQYMTIIFDHNQYSSTEEKLGAPLFGQAFYDVDGSAHERYGVEIDKGSVVVVRPDGTIGTACGLDQGSRISAYFAEFVRVGKKLELVEQDSKKEALNQGKGEVDIQAPGLQDWANMESA